MDVVDNNMSSVELVPWGRSESECLSVVRPISHGLM